MTASVNIIGTGKVGQSLMALLKASSGFALQDVHNRTHATACAAAAQLGVGCAVETLADMRDADLWCLTVPDDKIAQTAQDLAQGRGPVETGSPDPFPVAVHCSGFLSSQVLTPLAEAGWQVASCHPVQSFADPLIAARQFPGTYCALEGDPTAVALMRGAVVEWGGVPFSVQADRKALYHAAAVFSNNFTTVLQAIAREAWEASGVDPAVAEDLNSTLLASTVDNITRLGPREALTGPAARGDAGVLQRQEAEVATINPDAAEVYRLMSLLARRLKDTGRTDR